MPDISEAPVAADQLTLVYIAEDVTEAEKIRDLLETEKRVYFTGLTDFKLRGSLQAIFQSVNYRGVGFYSMKGEETATQILLAERGFKKGIIENE